MIVGTDDDGGPSVALFVEKGVEQPPVVGVDVRERLIEDHETGLADEGLGGQGSPERAWGDI